MDFSYHSAALPFGIAIAGELFGAIAVAYGRRGVRLALALTSFAAVSTSGLGLGLSCIYSFLLR